MGRLFTSGFELNSLTAGVEFDGSYGSGALSIISSGQRSGSYALQWYLTSSGYNTIYQILPSIAAGRTYYFRFYLQITTSVGANCEIAAFGGLAPSIMIWLNTDDTISLRDNSSGTPTTIGTSSALTKGTWYRVEFAMTYTGGAISARLNGIQFASGTASNPASVTGGEFDIGNYSTSTTGKWAVDDIAVNDDQGSYQNSWPGAGKVICLRPNGAGESAQWTRGGTDSGANWSQCNQTPPDDVTHYVLVSTLNYLDMYSCTDSGIGASDVVNVVEVGGRFNRSGTNVPTIKFRCIKTSGGTQALSAALTPSATAWRTNTNAAPRTSPIILYKDPDGANAWTQATLDTMQIGAVETVDSTANFYLSEIWAMVDYTPAGGPIPQAVAGGFYPAGAFTRQTLKLILGGAKPTGTVPKLAKKDYHGLSGGIYPAGVLTAIRLFVKAVSGAILPAGAKIHKAIHVIAAGIKPTGAVPKLAKKDYHGLSGAITPAGTFIRKAIKTFLAGLTSSGVVGISKMFYRALTAGLTASGTAARLPMKLILAGLTPAGALIKKMARALAGAFLYAGAVATQQTGKFYQAVSGGLSYAGKAIILTKHSISASLSESGAATIKTIRALAGGLTPSGALNALKAFFKTITGGFTPGPSTMIRKTLAVRMGGILPAGALPRKIISMMRGGLGPAGVKIHKAIHKIAAGLTSSGALVAIKGIFKTLTAGFTSSGKIIKAAMPIRAGALAPSGVIISRAMTKTLAGSLTMGRAMVKKIIRLIKAGFISAGALLHRFLSSAPKISGQINLQVTAPQLVVALQTRTLTISDMQTREISIDLTTD
jgi:hypothetical protein